MGSKKNKRSKQEAEDSPRASKASQNSPNPPSPPSPKNSPSKPLPSPRTPRPNRAVVLPTSSPILPPENVIRPNVRRLLSSDAVERLQPIYNAYGLGKRNFSELSSISLASSSDHNIAKMEADVDDERKLKHHLEVVRQKLKLADAAFEAKQATLRELR